MGNRGRLVVPAELRERAGMREGAVLVLLETELGVILLSREQLKSLVRADLAGADLVAQLLAERRANALGEDAA
jgi:bifunctional DNA-binding transcriptional regulator/antitoxin component of YhaV-PrlF toxin-antitoxin module